VHTGMSGILKPLIAEFKPSADAKGLALLEDWTECTLQTDPILLNRILRNLLSNAIKFTERGHIKISAKLDGLHVNLSIADTGLGIPVVEQDNIFQEYYQLGNSGRDRSEGIGLGLSVVKKMARLLDHEVRVVSSPGNGACFTVRMALGDPAATIDELDVPVTATVTGYTIMVIDDDHAVLRAMQIMLESWQCRAFIAESPAAALTILAQESIVPDIIISDFRLKAGLTGLDAIAAIRAHLNQDIPAILISGDSDPDLMRHMREHQLFLLHKPVKAAHLQNTLRQVLADQTTNCSRRASATQ
jgi:two-component system, sensor histidine kinase